MQDGKPAKWPAAMRFSFAFFALFAFSCGYFLNGLANLPTLVLRLPDSQGDGQHFNFVKLTVLIHFLLSNGTASRTERVEAAH
jgi:hypothetical protein